MLDCIRKIEENGINTRTYYLHERPHIRSAAKKEREKWRRDTETMLVFKCFEAEKKNWENKEEGGEKEREGGQKEKQL
jgi:hypothetical protein